VRKNEISLGFGLEGHNGSKVLIQNFVMEQSFNSAIDGIVRIRQGPNCDVHEAIIGFEPKAERISELQRRLLNGCQRVHVAVEDNTQLIHNTKTSLGCITEEEKMIDAMRAIHVMRVNRATRVIGAKEVYLDLCAISQAVQ
jgi:hypothetical protein